MAVRRTQLTTDRVIEILKAGPRSYRGIVQALEMEWQGLPDDLAEKLKVAVREGQITVTNDEIRGRLYGLPTG